MNALEQVALGAQALARTLRPPARAGAWWPFAILGAVELACLAALCVPAHPAVSWVLAPLVVGAAGERALHYPDGFAALPGLFAGVDSVLGWLLGSWAMGAAVHAFAAGFRKVPVPAGASLAEALRRWPALALCTLPVWLLLGALGAVGSSLAAAPGPAAELAPPAFAALRGLVVGFAFYLPALVMLQRLSGPAALAALPRAWGRGFWVALLPCAVALAPYAALGALLADPTPLVQRGTPELVAVLIGLRVAFGMAAGFVIAGSAALGYLATTEGRS
jgi:hypothetical protein